MSEDSLGGPLPISAVLITKDAEEHLERVLDPLAICSEIVVLDSGSVDRTREIALAHSAHWHEQPFDGYGLQKQRAVALAKNDWILSVDADEVLDDEATAAIGAIDWTRQDPSTSWRIFRRPFIGNHEILHTHWVPDPVVRIFNRTCHSFTDAPVHETVVPKGPVRTLSGSILHFSYSDYGDVLRMDHHRLKSVGYRASGRHASGITLAVRACWRFIYSYVLRRGFLDGRAGVVVALSGAVNSVMGLALASEEDDQGEEGMRGRGEEERG